MPRIVKKLPPNRADYTFGDLIYFHVFDYGTRPAGSPFAKTGDPWEGGAFCDLIGIDLRTLRNWIGDKHLPDEIGFLEKELFGNNALFDDSKLELRQALRVTRARNVACRKARRAGTANPSTSAIGPDKPAHSEAGQNFAGRNVPVLYGTGAALPASNESDDGGDQDDAYDDVADAWYVPASWKTETRENFGKVTIIPPEVFRARPGVRRIRRGPIVVAGLALLIGGYAWTRIPPVASGRNTSSTEEPSGRTAENEKEQKRKAQAEAERLEAERLVKEAADRQRKTDETRIAEERRKADEAQARANAEQKYQVGATKDAVEQKRIGDLANAQALNAKLKILAQADGNDLCKQKLEGLSVPGFTLKCDTQIPFGLLLGAVSVSQTASSLDDCAARCRKVVSPKCVAFSFDAGAHAGAASCYLTGSIPGYTPATNWIAGTR